MKLVRFSGLTGPHLGVVAGDEVVDLTAGGTPKCEHMVDLLSGDPVVVDQIRSALNKAPRLPLDTVSLLAPISRPPEFLAVGLNFPDHGTEVHRHGASRSSALTSFSKYLSPDPSQRPRIPVIFNKQSGCVTGPNDPVYMPTCSLELDYEGELGLVISRRCSNVSELQAREYIGGYFVVNDFSVRDIQMLSPTMTLGKSFDSHGPIGPWIVTTDEISDPQALHIRTYVNGEVRQSSSTAEMIFSCYELVAVLSSMFTLHPGTIIATGTPGGVGFFMDPPRYLSVGDLVRVEIDGIGALNNRIVATPATQP